MPERQHLQNLIEQLPDTEVMAAIRYLEFLIAREAPVDAEMLARIDQARAQPRSAGIAHEDVLREFGL